MTNPFPRGSEWRKWDLHVHAPGTKLNNAYASKEGEPDLEQFCQIVHDSDVAAVAVADYFSLDGYFAAKAKYQTSCTRTTRSSGSRTWSCGFLSR